MLTMLLSGLWHGAAWNFVLWGGYHGLLLVIYHQIGLGGKWKPQSLATSIVSWGIMFCLVEFGWLLFRTPDLAWLVNALSLAQLSFSVEQLSISLFILLNIVAYCIPLLVLFLIDRVDKKIGAVKPIYCAVLVCGIVLLHSQSSGEFIYFRF